MKNILLTVIVLFTAVAAMAQNSIKGKITDNNNNPLVGVNVIIKGTNKGAETNKEGFFKIGSIKSGNYDLKISMIGYNTKQISASTNQKLLIIKLTEKDNTLSEVVVSYSKKSKVPSTSLHLKTPIKALPQNIQVINNEILESQMVTNILEGAYRNVSGVSNIEHWGHFARINMRGFRLPAFRNGVNIQDSWGPLSEDMFMVDRIEFVKGPSGFMMAAGEPGGFYNVVTKKPTVERIAKISLMAGSFKTYRGAIDLGGSLTKDKRLLSRLNIMYQEAGSHRDFETSDRFGIAPSLSYKITNKTTALAEFNFQEVNTPIGAAYVFAPVSKGYASLDRNFSMVDSNYPNTNIEEVSFLTKLTHTFNDNWSAELKYVSMNYNQKGYSTWLVSLKENGDAVRYIGRWDAISKGDYFQAYVNGKFNTAGLLHKILVGYDFSDKNYWAHDFYKSNKIIDTAKPFNIFSPHYGDFSFPTFTREKGSIKDIKGVYNYGSKINSAYIQDELSFLENKVRLTLAGRYTSLSYKPFNKAEYVKYEKVTPRVGISADVSSNLTLYGLYDQSFVPASGVKKDGSKLKPIDGIIYEGGIKSSFIDNKIKTSLSAYIITKNNVTVGDTSNGKGDRFVVQLGEIQSKGFEFDLQGQITEELSVLFNYANTNVKVTKDTNPKAVGNRIAGHAKHSTNGWVNYNFSEDSALRGFGVSLGYQYQADRSSWAWGAKNKTDLPDYFRMDGALTWKNSKWRVGLNINNILDKYLYSGANYGSYLYWQSEPGVNARLSVSYSL